MALIASLPFVNLRTLAGLVFVLLLPVGAGAQQRSAPAAQPDPRVAEGEKALLRGEPAKALQLADAAIAARPANTAARMLAARAHLEQGELEAAWRELDAVLARAPNHVDALALMGLVSGRLAGATFETLEKRAPASARVQQLKGEALEAQEQRAEAEAAYEAALKADPNLLDALLPLARLKRIRLACDEAIPLYQRAEGLRPTPDGAYGLGYCYGFQQEDQKAVGYYQQAIKRDPSSAVAWSGLGTSLVKTGKVAEGIAALKRALAIEPKMSDGWYMLGLAYQAGKEPALAKEAFDRAEALRVGAKP
jgi:tetratricopeptide (TPR) repeat protein